MYRAKSNGRSRYELFNAAMQEWVTTHVALETAVRQAVPRNELRLYAQPVVESETGIVRSFKALVRWERPASDSSTQTSSSLPPEETGLIVDIGAWVLDKPAATPPLGHNVGPTANSTLR